MIARTLWLNVLAFGCLFGIWSKDGWFNMLLKLGLLIAALANLHAVWALR